MEKSAVKKNYFDLIVFLLLLDILKISSHLFKVMENDLKYRVAIYRFRMLAVCDIFPGRDCDYNLFRRTKNI